MKRITYIRLTALLSVLLYTTVSCDKLPKNGDLEGNWQLTEITTYQENEANQVTTEEVKYKKIFWNFQQDLLCIHFYNGAYQPQDKDGISYNEFFARFNHQGSTLNLPQIYVHDSRSTDSLLNEPYTRILEHSGIIGNKATFEVKVLNKEQMILESRTKKTNLIFRKF